MMTVVQKSKRIRLRWQGGTHWFEIEGAPLHPPVQGLGTTGAELRASLRRMKTGHEPAPLHDREGAVLARLFDRTYGSADVLETIFSGLVGGGDLRLDDGTQEEERYAARELLQKHVAPKPLSDSAPLAIAILCAAVFGIDETIAGAGATPDEVAAAVDNLLKEVAANG